MSDAAIRHHRGDAQGAREAAASLMDRYPTDRRVLRAAVSLGALTGDTGITKRASRMLQVTAWDDDLHGSMLVTA